MTRSRAGEEQNRKGRSGEEAERSGDEAIHRVLARAPFAKEDPAFPSHPPLYRSTVQRILYPARTVPLIVPVIFETPTRLR